MKLLALILIIGCLHAGAAGYSQSISLTENKASLGTVLDKIKQQCGYGYLADESLLKKAVPVTIRLKNSTLQQALITIFKDQPLNYEIIGKTIVVKEKIIQQPETKQHYDPLTDITGRVVNEHGEPVAGATVAVKGTSNATATNSNGAFEINAIANDAVLIITGANIEKIEWKIKNQKEITVIVKTRISKLDEIKIIGYGTTTNRYATADVSKVTKDEISRQPISNPVSTLQGRATGVFISNSNGLPGADVKIQIRGQNSISAGNDPLYIVDGVPFISTALNSDNFYLQAANGKISPFNSINPNDIESIEILKDADATAIYGSRGANGVILITTKRGHTGKLQTNLIASAGVSKAPQKFKMLNTQEYVSLRKQAFANDGVTPTVSNAPDLLLWDTTSAYTNWSKYLSGKTATFNDIQLSLNGGTSTMRFRFGLNRRHESTVYLGNFGLTRTGANLNVDFTSENKKLNGSINTSYSNNANNIIPGFFGLSNFYNLPPNYPLNDSSGQLYWGGGKTNPIAYLKQTAKDITNYFIANIQLKYELYKNLSIRLSTGYTTIGLSQIQTFPKSSQDPNYSPLSYSIFSDNSYIAYIAEPYASYKKKLINGNVEMIAGGSWQKSIREGYFLQANNFNSESMLESLSAAGNLTEYTNTFTDYRYLSFYSRINCNFNGRYLFTSSFRRDGSSRFGPDRQFGNFWAVASGWIFSNESFFKNYSVLSFGKLKASFGITGNDQIPDYQYLSTYNSNSLSLYQNIAGLQPSRISNAKYGWETNRKYETSLELGFFDNRLLLTTAWYRNISGNQLVDYAIPIQTGFNSYQANLPATIKNTGLEFEVNATIIKDHSLEWQASFNITFNKNKLISFPGLSTSSYANTYVEGQSLGIIKGYRFTGIDQQTGLTQFEDINKDGLINSSGDYIIIGDILPKYFGGFSNTIRYNGWQLDIFLQFVHQTGYNYSFTYPPGYSRFNYPVIVLERWQKPGDITSISAAGTTASKPIFRSFFQKYSRSNQLLGDASYLRLKNISFSYQLSESIVQRIKFKNIKIFIEGQNLALFTKYYGFDPETQNVVVPPLSVLALGLNINF